MKTQEFTLRHGKPLLHIHAGIHDAAAALIEFVRRHKIRLINLAGSRESKEPEAGRLTTSLESKKLPVLALPGS